MEKTRIAALKFEQDGINMYLAAPIMRELLGKCKMDEWRPSVAQIKHKLTNEEYVARQGYQRKPTQNRLKQISKYLISAEKRGAVPSIFPSTVLLSYREGRLKFVPFAEGQRIGYLEIDENDTFYIVDGQHRFKGLEYAIHDDQVEEFEEFQLPVTILECKNKADEIKQFALINNTQKKIKTDLGDRLLEMLKTDFGRHYDSIAGLQQKDWKTWAVKIAERLNSDPKSPWFGRIIRPNAPRTELAVAGESEFTKSLKNILLSTYAKGPSETAENRIYEIINEYWGAWKEIIPEAFESPSEYVIQKTTGFHSLNKILTDVTRECADQYGRDRSTKRFKVILKRIENSEEYPDALTADWWKSGEKGAASIVGMGPIISLASDFEKAIQHDEDH